MAKADVLQLVADFSNSRADQTQAGDYYDQIIDEMGRGNVESLVNASLQAVTAGDGSYTFPTATIMPLAIIYDDKQLMRLGEMEVEAADALWRETQGTPIGYVVEDEDTRTIQLYPTPINSGDTIGASTPFVLPHPQGNLTYIFTERRATAHAWEELWLALEILAREFARDSDHQDIHFSKTCRGLALILRAMISPLWTNG